MPATGPRAKNWCFTLNNYTPADLDRLSALVTDSHGSGVSYLIFGKEVGDSGTPHLQGTVCFRSRKRLQQVISVIGQAHCSVTRFLRQSIEYCQKDGDFSEFGELELLGKGKEKNCDLEEFKSTVKEGVSCPKELREIHSSVCAMHPKFVKEYIEDNRVKPKVCAF